MIIADIPDSPQNIPPLVLHSNSPLIPLMSNEEIKMVSARKLAARLWQSTATGGRRSQHQRLNPLLFQHAVGEVRFPSDLFRRKCGANIKSWLNSPLPDQFLNHGFLVKDWSSLPFFEFSLEGATKWDKGYTNISTVASLHMNNVKNLKNQEVAVVPVVSLLQAKLEQVRVGIKELKTERKKFKKEAVMCLRKLGEEKISSMKREHKKLRIIVNDLKNDLKSERRGRKRVQMANAKLHNDVVNAKLAVKEIMKNYEKEKKTRELMEEACHELAKKVEDGKTEILYIKRQSLKLLEQLEVEKKMLQTAEIWREERVKIKMADAKLILEEKCHQLNNLIADLEDFLRSKDESLDMIEISEGEVIRQAIKSAEIKEIADILCSTIDEHQNNQVRNAESNPVQKSFSGYIDHGGTDNKEKGTSHIPDECNYTVDKKNTDGTMSAASCITGNESLKSEISDMCSALLANQGIKKSSIRRDSNVNKIISYEKHTRSENGLMGRMGNPHITRAMKGCLEWPQGMSKNGLKGKLLDSR